MIELFLPYPPSLNSLYSHTKYGIYLSKAGRKYVQAIEIAIIEQRSISDPIAYNIKVDMILFTPDKRKRDIDNYSKCLLDALTKASLWEDDSLIDVLKIYRGEISKGKGIAYLRIKEAESGAVVKLSQIGL